MPRTDEPPVDLTQELMDRAWDKPRQGSGALPHI